MNEIHYTVYLDFHLMFISVSAYFFLHLLSVVPDYVKYFLISVSLDFFIPLHEPEMQLRQYTTVKVKVLRGFRVSSQVNDKSFTNASALWYYQFVSEID